MWRTTIRAALPLVLLLTVACSGDEERPISERLRTLDPAEPATLAPVESDDVRDVEDVTAALWAVDPCALVPDDVSGDRPASDRVEPHLCSFRYRGREVKVRAGAYLGADDRFGSETTRVDGGVKAYQAGGGRGDEDDSYCRVTIPVGPSHAIVIADDNVWGGNARVSCDLSRRIAAYAVSRIRNGDAGPAPLPATRDTCSRLDAALGADSDRYRLVFGGRPSTIDACAALPVDPHGAEPAPRPYARMTVDEPVADVRPSIRVNGRPVHRRVYPSRSTHRSQCTMRWRDQSTVSVTTRSCALTRHLVERSITSDDRSAEPSDDVPRVRFYRPGEPERGGVGACRDYVAGSEVPRAHQVAAYLPPGPDCHPYQQPELPDDAAEKLVAAEADPNVTCALAQAAVDKTVTSDMAPTTLAAAPPEVTARFPIRTRPCVFVDGYDGSQILVVASTEPIPKNLARRNGDPWDGEPVQDLRFAPEVGSYARLATAAQAFGDSVDDPGYLAVIVGPDPPYETDVLRGGSLGSDDRDQAVEILDTIVDEHFEETS